MRSIRSLRLATLAISLTGILGASCSPELPESTARSQMEHRLQGPRPHALCGWLYEHPDDADTEVAYDTFAAHADDFDAVHPKWWRVGSPTTIVNHVRGTSTPYRGFHDRRVLDHTTPGGAHTRLIPLVAATAPGDAAFVHRMINDPDLRAAHVAALTDVAVDNGYDGLDLDYEHLAAAMESTPPHVSMAHERAAMSAFIAAVADALHAHGKELSLAIPVNTSGSSGFDLEAISAAADEIHVMGYDFHYEGGDHPGPTAPLGWLQGFIDHVASMDGGQRASRFILGLPNYGNYGAPGGEVLGCEPLSHCYDLFDGGYATTTDELERHGEGDVGPGRSPNVALGGGKHLYFEDLASLEEKVAAAKAGGFGGISYWGIGGEPTVPGPRTFFQMVRSHFPRP